MAPSLDVRTGNSTYTVKWNGDLNYITDDITVYGDDPDLGKQVLIFIAVGQMPSKLLTIVDLRRNWLRRACSRCICLPPYRST